MNATCESCGINYLANTSNKLCPTCMELMLPAYQTVVEANKSSPASSEIPNSKDKPTVDVVCPNCGASKEVEVKCISRAELCPNCNELMVPGLWPSFRRINKSSPASSVIPSPDEIRKQREEKKNAKKSEVRERYKELFGTITETLVDIPDGMQTSVDCKAVKPEDVKTFIALLEEAGWQVMITDTNKFIITEKRTEALAFIK